jgi:hypothetical protein
MPSPTSGSLGWTSVERLFLTSRDGSLPWTVHGEVSFDGQVSRARLQEALAAVRRRHPVLRWQASGQPEGSWCSGRSATPILQPREAPDDQGLARQRSELLYEAMDLHETGPLVIRLIRTSNGDNLLAAAHHALVDGVGMFRILADLARAYRAEQLEPEITWAEARRSYAAEVDPALAAAIEEEVRSKTRRTAVRVAGGDPSSHRGTGAVLHRLEVTGRPSGPAGTSNDRLLAAVGVALREWNTERQEPSDPVVIGIPLNLRPLDAWHDSVCNAILMWPVRIPAEGDHPAVLRAVARQTAPARLGRRSRAARGLIGALRGREALPLWALHAMAATTVVSSVVGVEHALSFGPDAPEVTAAWGTPPTSQTSGIAFSACLDQGHAWIAARYDESIMSASIASELLTRVAKRFDAT